MKTRQCYHVTVPLADSKEANIYFNSGMVHVIPKSSDTAFLHQILQSISHQLASISGPQDYYIDQLRKDMTQGDGGGLHITFVSVGKTPADIYSSQHDLLGLDPPYTENPITIEPLPPALDRIASSMQAGRRVAAIQHDRSAGIEIIREKKQAQAEKKRAQEEKEARDKAEKKAEEQKKLAAENAKIKTEKDLRAAKKMFRFGKEAESDRPRKAGGLTVWSSPKGCQW